MLRKNDEVMARAWRAAEAGRLRQLPQSSNVRRLTWQQKTMRCMSSMHALYGVNLAVEGTAWQVTTPVEGLPCAADLLRVVATQCMVPMEGGEPRSPKLLLLLSYRCKALFAELQDAIFGRWGIPLQLQSELEALRAAKEGGEHYLGLQSS